MRTFRIFCLSAIAAALCGAARAEVRLNEIWINQVGTDTDEFFELTGDAGESLDGYTLVCIGDTTSGRIEAVVDLTGSTIPADGYFLCTESTFNTGLYGTPDKIAGASLNFENDDNVTYLLVTGFTGANAQDLDTNDDGVLDATPWTEVVDSVAVIIDPTSTTSEHYYSATTVGPDDVYMPSHVYRSPNASGDWQIGDFGNPPVTPGEPNGTPTTLSGNVNLQLIAVSPAGQQVDIEIRVPSTVTVVGSYTVTLDASGNYSIDNPVTGVYDVAAKSSNWLRQVVSSVDITGAAVADFSLINGDADPTNAIDIFDLNTALTNFASVGPAGDVNKDGVVDVFDLNAILGTFGQVGMP